MKTARLFRLALFGFLALGLLQCELPAKKTAVAAAPVSAPPPPPPPAPVKIVKIAKPGAPEIEYWQDATLDGGLAFFNEILEKAKPEEVFAILFWLGVMSELGYEIRAVRVKFSNPHYQKIVVSPEQFRVRSGWGGQSYPLGVFLVPRDGDIEHWKKVSMPVGSSIELYGYYAAPKNFVGSTLYAK